ncbi:uncharacterized protein [Diabrotica undecimpunctata]|uniref:uncharacterized protein isoform X1 n=2 Tax=Diabrotica undecimpunctata TaxID=50387 RepID=UPI003B63FA7E
MIDFRKETTRVCKKEFLKGIRNIYALIDELGASIVKSAKLDRLIFMALNADKLKNQNMEMQLNETSRENKQLIDMLQLDERVDKDLSRTDSNTSCGTVSLVHLQYKYEELVKNQNGLLKILDIRHNEVRKCQSENARLRQEIENFKFMIQKYDIEFTKLLDQAKRTKNRKNKKIHKLKSERDTLRLVHNRFVSLLTEQSIEKDNVLIEQLQNTSSSEKALLIQEVRKTNILTYENFQLQQKLDYLQSKLNCKKPSTSRTSSSLSQ